MNTELLNHNYRYRHLVFVCLNNTNTVVLLDIAYGYNGLLQLVVMFVAFQACKVKIMALNDSKEIAAIIYIHSPLVLLVVVEFALSTYHA